MALETSIKFIGQSKDGRSVTIKDSTGFQAYGKPNGYNDGIVSGILAYYFTVSRMFDSLEYQVKIDGTNQYLPTPQQIARGYNVELTTALFKYEGERGSIEPIDMFKDGVLDLNMYVAFSGMSGVTIEKGTNFIYGPAGTSFTEQLKADSVIVNDQVYMIDKGVDVDTNGNTIIYILGQFEEDATSFTVGYRANLKVLLTGVSENLHDYATALLSKSIEHPDWKKINVAMAFRRAAFGFFRDEDNPDYAKANDLVNGGYQLLKKFTI